MTTHSTYNIRNFLIQELHATGLAGHFGQDKIICSIQEILLAQFKRQVVFMVASCRTCITKNFRNYKQGLYTHYPCLISPKGKLVSILSHDIQKSVRRYDSILIVQTCFQKWLGLFLVFGSLTFLVQRDHFSDKVVKLHILP